MNMPHSALSTEHWLTIWSYVHGWVSSSAWGVPTDFSVPVVSVAWKKTWAALWATLSSLSLDFRNSRIGGHPRAVALARWSALLDRLPATLSSLSLDFNSNIGEGGARAVAEGCPPR